MNKTTRWGLPYPELVDTPDVPRDIKALAERLEALLDETMWYTGYDASPGTGVANWDSQVKAVRMGPWVSLLVSLQRKNLPVSKDQDYLAYNLSPEYRPNVTMYFEMVENQGRNPVGRFTLSPNGELHLRTPETVPIDAYCQGMAMYAVSWTIPTTP